MALYQGERGCGCAAVLAHIRTATTARPAPHRREGDPRRIPNGWYETTSALLLLLLFLLLFLHPTPPSLLFASRCSAAAAAAVFFTLFLIIDLIAVLFIRLSFYVQDK